MKFTYLYFAMMVFPFTSMAGYIPPKLVSLSCGGGHALHCSISRSANPQGESNCWYDLNGVSYGMRHDYQNGFYNDQVHVWIQDGMTVTGKLLDLRSMTTYQCTQI